MTSPNNGNGPRDRRPATDSLTVDLVIVEGNEDTTERPLRPSLAIHAAYERDRMANPTTPRPYRPYLTPPPHNVPPPPAASSTPPAAPTHDTPETPPKP